MGYDFHITRAANWSESEDAPITADEWLALVEADSELTLNPANGPYSAVWTGRSLLADPWLDWEGGNIYTKNPDSALLRKMAAIAALLGARVQGDDAELYQGDETLETDARSSSEQDSAAPTTMSWWRWFRQG